VAQQVIAAVDCKAMAYLNKHTESQAAKLFADLRTELHTCLANFFGDLRAQGLVLFDAEHCKQLRAACGIKSTQRLQQVLIVSSHPQVCLLLQLSTSPACQLLHVLMLHIAQCRVMGHVEVALSHTHNMC
jgi:hypothetical protein